MLERERPWDSSFNEANESIAEQLNYCLMGKRNLLAGRSVAMLLGWRGGKEQLLHPRAGWQTSTPGSQGPSGSPCRVTSSWLAVGARSPSLAPALPSPSPL